MRKYLVINHLTTLSQLLKHRETIIQLLSLLLEKTKSERGYSGTAALVSRVLHTLTTVYPINNHFVNSDQWIDPGRTFDVVRIGGAW